MSSYWDEYIAPSSGLCGADNERNKPKTAAMKSIIQLLVCCSLVISIWGKPSTIFFQSAHSVVSLDSLCLIIRSEWRTQELIHGLLFLCVRVPAPVKIKKVNARIKTHEKADRIRGVPALIRPSLVVSFNCLSTLSLSAFLAMIVAVGRISRVGGSHTNPTVAF